jgi:3-phenylpropionate/trans-cinnamate dioxygenase ferredoxin reductase component
VPASRTFVIVGAGLCGGTAAATLRKEGFDGRLVLIGAEPLPPYERPPMSKEYLRGEQSLDEAFVHAPEWFEEHGVEARFGQHVERVDGADRCVFLSGGQRINYDSALVATGVRNRRLDVPGVELDGVWDLRTAQDADRIRAGAKEGRHALIVGMGFIGAEVAASLRLLGLDVTIIEIFETALYRVLGAEVGRVLESIHRDHGVAMLFNETVERFEGDGRFEAAITRSGERIEADFAVVGVGTEPVSSLGRGLTIDAGAAIEVDATLRTNVEGVFAAGDVARHDHRVFGPMRVEHFDNAMKMGEAAARNMLGAAEAYDDPHWFWSDQYDSNLQVSGFAPKWDQRVIRGSLAERRFAAFYLHHGVLRQTVTLDYKRDARRSLALISAEVRPDPALLADPDVDLRTLMPNEE